jgi:hypothetical protein
VRISYLEIVLVGDRRAVADPLANHVQRKPGGQFGLPTRPHVVEQAGPRLQTGSFDDPQELRSQIGALIPISRDYEGSPRRGLIPSRFQVRPQFRDIAPTVVESCVAAPGFGCWLR